VDFTTDPEYREGQAQRPKEKKNAGRNLSVIGKSARHYSGKRRSIPLLEITRGEGAHGIEEENRPIYPSCAFYRLGIASDGVTA
jgi:hypothetical protein